MTTRADAPRVIAQDWNRFDRLKMRIDVDRFGFCFVLFGWPGRTRRLTLPFGSSQDDRGSVRLSWASAKSPFENGYS